MDESEAAGGWSKLSLVPPYVDRADIDTLAALKPVVRSKLQTQLLPIPWIGAANARLIVLLLNPGYKPEDDVQQAQGTDLYRLQRQALVFKNTQSFYPLLPSLKGSAAHNWYSKRLGRLIADCGINAVHTGVMFMQYFPYRSERADFSVPLVPSLSRSIEILRQAMKRRAYIVLARSRQYWLKALPELAEYECLHSLRNARSPFISPGNLGATSYDAICSTLRNGPAG